MPRVRDEGGCDNKGETEGNVWGDLNSVILMGIQIYACILTHRTVYQKKKKWSLLYVNVKGTCIKAITYIFMSICKQKGKHLLWKGDNEDGDKKK